MPYVFQTSPEGSFLASYRLPKTTFAERPDLPEALHPVWQALRTDNPRAAIALAREKALDPALQDDGVRAAVVFAQAAAEWRSGAADAAKRLAEESLALCPGQWAAHRLLVEMLVTQNHPESAYLYLSTLELPEQTPVWDERLSREERHLMAAALSWTMRDWDGVAVHLAEAYPEGVCQMPAPLQEDAFRLALYRSRPEDAATAAACLIAGGSIEFADALLQTIVQRGWTQQALPLYREIFSAAPENQLLRRRLVALCIREGAIEEARRLARPSALNLAV